MNAKSFDKKLDLLLKDIHRRLELAIMNRIPLGQHDSNLSCVALPGSAKLVIGMKLIYNMKDRCLQVSQNNLSSNWLRGFTKPTLAILLIHVISVN